jgi:hypothetical protein
MPSNDAAPRRLRHTKYLVLRASSSAAFPALLLKRDMRTHVDRPPRWLAALCAAVGLTLLTAQGATVTRSPVPCEGIKVLSDELTLREAEEYCLYAAEERKKVDAFWGATWTEPIRIHVSSAYRISRALVPGISAIEAS